MNTFTSKSIKMTSQKEDDLLNKINEANHKLTANIYKVLFKEKNLIFSPFSIQMALILLYLGAECNTAKEIATVLNLSLKNKHLLKGMRILLNQLRSNNFTPAIEIFISKKHKLKESYRKILKKYLGSSTPRIDFKDAMQAREVINLWIEKETNDKIENFYSEENDDFDINTNLVLVNTIYFKDHWLKQFEYQNMKISPFHSLSSGTVDVFMMHISEIFRYAEKDFYKILELPYQNRNFRMIIFLPNENEKFSLLESELASIDLVKVLQYDLKLTNVKLKLPIFNIQHYIDYVDVLKDLGIRSMFKKHANFFGMCENTDLPICVDSILYKGFVDVDRHGTVLGVFDGHCTGTSDNSDSLNVPLAAEFHAEHPFIFYILYNNTILFMGRLYEFIYEDEELSKHQRCSIKCFWRK